MAIEVVSAYTICTFSLSFYPKKPDGIPSICMDLSIPSTHLPIFDHGGVMPSAGVAVADMPSGAA